jgi:hypothetical protein
MPRPKFQKGNKLGKGRPPLTEQDKEVRALTKARLNEVISKILGSTPEEIIRMKEDKNTDALTAWILSGAVKGIKTGDMDQLEKVLLNRTLGKVKEQVEVSGNAVSVVIGLPPNGSEKPKDGG